MAIQSVTSATQAPAAPPVPPVALPGQAKAEEKSALPAPVPVPAPAPAPPPPPPEGFAMDVEVGYHEETNTKVYNFVDPDSGDTVVQIPIENVLNMVAGILRQLEAEGKR
jgi:hypothetical protein